MTLKTKEILEIAGGILQEMKKTHLQMVVDGEPKEMNLMYHQQIRRMSLQGREENINEEEINS